MNNQSWVNDYYYPVLPKYKANGSFSNDLGGKIPFGNSDRSWNDDDLLSPVTNEQYQDDSLLLNYTSEYLDNGILLDNSGFDNVGVCLNDYRVVFDEKTIEPKKNVKRFKLKNRKK